MIHLITHCPPIILYKLIEIKWLRRTMSEHLEIAIENHVFTFHYLLFLYIISETWLKIMKGHKVNHRPGATLFSFLFIQSFYLYQFQYLLDEEKWIIKEGRMLEKWKNEIRVIDRPLRRKNWRAGQYTSSICLVLSFLSQIDD